MTGTPLGPARPVRANDLPRSRPLHAGQSCCPSHRSADRPRGAPSVAQRTIGVAPRQHRGREDAPVDGRILLVEDDASIREIVALGLRAIGFDVVTAADGPSGLERWQATGPDL